MYHRQNVITDRKLKYGVSPHSRVSTMSTTLAEVQGAVAQLPNQDAATAEHTRAVNTTKQQLKEEVIKLGCTTDEDIRFIDGKYVGLFVLPSPNNVYVGFGAMGGRTAYRGAAAEFDAAKAAALIVESLKK